jgi:vancomycin resistance protein VanW
MAVSSLHPWLYTLSVKCHTLARQAQWWRANRRLAHARSDDEARFRYKVTRHRSILMRQLGDVDMQLQRNKVTNLRLATARLQHIVIAPGETFSFWQLVGEPSARRGYVEGLLIHSGRMRRGVGGGLCQLSNLVYWLALHTPLVVTERHHHQFDAFPDSGRVLPFGSGATVFYNYVDLQITNPTDQAFRLSVWLTETELCGSIESDAPVATKIHVRERDHRFVRRGGQVYRENRLYRVSYDRATGNLLGEEPITHNFAPVMSDLPPELAATLVDEDAAAAPAVPGALATQP